MDKTLQVFYLCLLGYCETRLLVLEPRKYSLEFDLDILLNNFLIPLQLFPLDPNKCHLLLRFRPYGIDLTLEVLLECLLPNLRSLLNSLNDVVGARVRLLTDALLADQIQAGLAEVGDLCVGVQGAKIRHNYVIYYNTMLFGNTIIENANPRASSHAHKYRNNKFLKHILYYSENKGQLLSKFTPRYIAESISIK